MRVLLLGDSIRMSYQDLVATSLAAEATVWGPPENCQYSLYTLSSLGRWLAAFEAATGGGPQVVHWNNGIHDVGHNPARAPAQMPLDVYRGNLRFIGRQLLATGARVVFATSTPVHPERGFLTDRWSWRNAEIDAYNAAARKVMEELDIPVNDLHELVAANPNGLLSDDQLHLSAAGRAACAAAVVDAVRAAASAG